MIVSFLLCGGQAVLGNEGLKPLIGHCFQRPINGIIKPRVCVKG